MPQIIVTADQRTDRELAPVLLRERVSLADFESDHFAAQLVERLGWAVEDANEVERQPAPKTLEHTTDPEPHTTDPEPHTTDPEPHAQPRASAKVVTTAS
jgi:hypothetical protein